MLDDKTMLSAVARLVAAATSLSQVHGASIPRFSPVGSPPGYAI